MERQSALTDKCFCLWFLGKVIMFIIHAFWMFPPLLRTDKSACSLYIWFSVEEENTTVTRMIYPGESPAYFEVARFSAAVSVAVVFLNCLINRQLRHKSTRQRLFTLVIIWLPSLSLGTTLGLVGAYYKDDDRWKDSNPCLVVTFKVLAGLAAVHLLWACYSCFNSTTSIITVIRDQQLCRQRQDRQSRRPPNAESISDQGEKNQTLCCQKLNSAKIKACILWKNQTRCCQRLNSAKIKACILWRHLYRKLVTAMKRLKACICRKRLSRKPVMAMESLRARRSGKHLSSKLVIIMESLMTSIIGKRLSRKLVITMKHLGPGIVQNLPDNPLHDQPGQPKGHGSPPIRHAPGGPAGDLPSGIVQNDALDTSSVTAGHSGGAARYNAADAYRLGDTTIHQTTGQDDVSRYTTMDSVIHQTAGQGEVSRYTTMDSVILQDAPPEWSGRSAAMDPVIGQGGQEELSRSHSARDAPRVHSICRPQLTLADFHSFVDPRTSRPIFQLRHPGQRGADPFTSTYM